MRLAVGNAGWVQVSEDPDLRGVLYVRLAADSAGAGGRSRSMQTAAASRPCPTSARCPA